MVLVGECLYFGLDVFVGEWMCLGCTALTHHAMGIVVSLSLVCVPVCGLVRCVLGLRLMLVVALIFFLGA